jgi:hypothetical protein
MTAEDLLALAPWLAFVAGLAVITWRLLAHRSPRPRPRPGPPLAARTRTGRRHAPVHRQRPGPRKATMLTSERGRSGRPGSGGAGGTSCPPRMPAPDTGSPGGTARPAVNAKPASDLQPGTGTIGSRTSGARND